MLYHSHRRTKKQIERLFTAGLTGNETKKLWESLYRCPTCGAFYEQCALLERALTGAPNGVPVFSIERTRDVITSRHSDRKMTWDSRWMKWSAVFTGAVGVLLIWLMAIIVGPESHRVSLPSSDTHISRELVSRGTSRAVSSYVGFRVFAVTPKNRGAKEKSVLHIDDIITFTYTYAKNNSGYLMLFGLQESTKLPLWYYPNWDEEKSISISGNQVDKPLGDGIVLSVNHRAGPLRIVSLFSDEPIDVKEVEEAVRMLREYGNLMNPDIPLPLNKKKDRVIEHSALVSILNTP